jgi:hypothetical protein
MIQNTFIPDISYHLIFSFLSIRELAPISQCSKEWRRIVTEPSFFNMYRQTGVLTIDNKNNVSKSPLRRVIRKVRIETLNNEINHLGSYNRLEVLDMTFDRIYFSYFDPGCDFISIFKQLGPKLTELIVRLQRYKHKINTYSFIKFQTALHFLTSLTSLKLQNVFYYSFISDISFLSVMKQLQSFSCNCIGVSSKELAATLQSSCPDLIRLEVGHFNNLNDLEEICQGLQYSKLTHLGDFSNLSRFDQNLYAQSLNKLNHLQTIEYFVFYQNIPHISLGKWIHYLEIFDMFLNDEDVNSILALPYLKSLKMHGIRMNDSQIENLIHGLSSRLEHLDLVGEEDFQISFKSLSKCIQLKTISFSSILFTNNEEILLLSNCKQLESIMIPDLLFFNDDEIYQAFEIPSTLFPKLKLAVI